MSELLFSIVVPAYNVAAYLGECIESVLKQDCLSWELILVNDGSTDETLRICQEYARGSNRIRVIDKSNGGLVSARKAGARAAKGDYVVCLDGDDWLEPGGLSSIERIVKQYRDIEMVCFGIASVGSKERRYSKPRNRTGLYNREQIESEIFPMLIEAEDASYFAPSLCGKAIKRELYTANQMRVDNHIAIGEDGACTIPIVLSARSVFVMDSFLYCYRDNDESMTKRKRGYSWEGPRILLKHLNAITTDVDYDFSGQISRRIVHELFRVSVSRFYEPESYNRTRRDIIRHLESSEMRDQINKCSFAMKLKPKLMEFAIKRRLVFLLYCYSCIK